MSSKIRVHRKAYTRKDGTHVKSTTFLIKDLGKKGHGPKLIKVKKGAMTKYAFRLGYINPGERISDINLDTIDNFARDLVSLIGKKSALGMFRAQITFRKRQRKSPFKNKMQVAYNAIRKIKSDIYINKKNPRETGAGGYYW